MAGYLQNKMSIAAFEQELTCRRSANRQSTQNERPGAESEILLPLFTLQMDQLNSVELSSYLLRDFKLESFRLNRRPIGQGSTSRVSRETSPTALSEMMTMPVDLASGDRTATAQFLPNCTQMG